jgi:hypothetical protein
MGVPPRCICGRKRMVSSMSTRRTATRTIRKRGMRTLDRNSSKFPFLSSRKWRLLEKEKSFSFLFFSWSVRGRNGQALVYHNLAIFRPLKRDAGRGYWE